MGEESQRFFYVVHHTAVLLRNCWLTGDGDAVAGKKNECLMGGSSLHIRL